MQGRWRWSGMTFGVLLLAGCGGGGGGGSTAGNDGHNPNQVPTIAGSPAPSVTSGEPFSFRPRASDADYDTLNFSIANKPGWAQFETDSGRLHGYPEPADVGVYTGIVISVSDGQATVSLPAFEIEVNEFGEASVTLSWQPPTQNADGSALTDLAGYRIYMGKAEDTLNRVIVLRNPGLTAYVVENLSPATWYFAMSSFNRHGRESGRSAVVRKRVG